jgi:hypothetical protein
MTGAEGGAQAKEERERGAAVRATCRGVDRVERAGRGRLQEEEGKVDKWAPLVSCPRKEKVKGRAGGGWQAGPWWPRPWGPCAFCGERRRGAGLGHACVGWPWAARAGPVSGYGPKGV